MSNTNGVKEELIGVIMGYRMVGASASHGWNTKYISSVCKHKLYFQWSKGWSKGKVLNDAG